jgi:hypothetical protein
VATAARSTGGGEQSDAGEKIGGDDGEWEIGEPRSGEHEGKWDGRTVENSARERGTAGEGGFRGRF